MSGGAGWGGGKYSAFGLSHHNHYLSACIRRTPAAAAAAAAAAASAWRALSHDTFIAVSRVSLQLTTSSAFTPVLQSRSPLSLVHALRRFFAAPRAPRTA